ncbi:MAG: hypothetical protein ACREIT_02240 [Tepidisphaeraceae bacterium]
MTRRAVIVHCGQEECDHTAAAMLLSGMGHEVIPTASLDEAAAALGGGALPADLLIIDASGAGGADAANLIVPRLLDELPADHQPLQVAIFSSQMDGRLAALRRRLSPARVHVFLKPLHLHGLLGVLRHLDADQDRRVAAS